MTPAERSEVTPFESKALEVVCAWEDASPVLLSTSGRHNLAHRVASALLVAVEEERAECAKICDEHADGYRSLQERARAAVDGHAALAHLCEKDASLMLAREIRARGEKR